MTPEWSIIRWRPSLSAARPAARRRRHRWRQIHRDIVGFPALAAEKAHAPEDRAARSGITNPPTRGLCWFKAPASRMRERPSAGAAGISGELRPSVSDRADSLLAGTVGAASAFIVQRRGAGRPANAATSRFGGYDKACLQWGRGRHTRVGRESEFQKGLASQIRRQIHTGNSRGPPAVGAVELGGGGGSP